MLARSLVGEDAGVLRETDFRLLLLANMVAPLGDAVLSPVLDTLTGPLNATPASIGLVMSAFSAPPILLLPLAGLLADRYGRKPMLVGGLLLFGIAGTLIAFTNDFRVVLGLRLFQGIGFAGTTPIIITSIGDMYDGTVEATAQGLRNTSSGISQTVSPLLAGGIVLLGWQYPFYLYAVSLPVALMVFLWFEEPTDFGMIRDGRSQDDDLPGFIGMLSRRRIAAMVVARAFPMLFWVGFLTYNSLFVKTLLGGSPVHAGILAAVASFGYATTATQAGRITAMFESRYYPLILANILLGAGFLVLLVAPVFIVAALGIATAGCAMGVLLSLYRSIITGLGPQELRGRLVTVSEAFSRLVATLTPLGMGATLAILTPALGFNVALQFAGIGVAVLAGAGGVASIYMVRQAPVPFPDESVDGCPVTPPGR